MRDTGLFQCLQANRYGDSSGHGVITTAGELTSRNKELVVVAILLASEKWYCAEVRIRQV